LQLVRVQLDGGGAPQTLATPPPQQLWLDGHAPQVTLPPQPSPMVPQYWVLPLTQPWRTQPAGAGVPHTAATPPPPQLVPAGQEPQVKAPPQPSPIVPQYCALPLVQLVATQPAGGGVPHTPGIPPAPQLVPAGQAPQVTAPPQPLPMVPQ
jgi:hypothetical protein